MATLTSPGVSITVTDESQYLPTGVGTVPLVLVATAQDKTSPAGSVASGTTKSMAGMLQSFTSQRDLITALGYPKFQTSAGSPLHGDERNEYGLQAAYSALGVGSSAYVIRADIDLAALTSTAQRPTGTVADGTVWFDLNDTAWGIYEWDQPTQAYAEVMPRVLTSASQVSNDTLNTPLATVGQIGDYAVVPYNVNNPIFYKNQQNAWVAVGTTAWQQAYPTIQSSFATYAGNEVADGTTITINGVIVHCTATNGVTCTANDVVNSINGAFTANFGQGIGAALDSNGKLTIIATALSASNGSTADGKVIISSGAGATALGFVAGTYYAPMFTLGGYTNVPTYATGEATPAPSGSVWLKTTSTGQGANWVVQTYNASSKKFVAKTAPLYVSKEDALYQLDPLNGGQSIASGSLFVDTGSLNGYPATFKIFSRNGSGQTKVTGAVPSASFTVGQTFTLAVSQPGNPALTAYAFSGTFAINSTTSAGLVALILSRNIPNVYAQLESNGAISLIHLTGGDIVLVNTTVGGGNPISTAGFTTAVSGIEYEATGTYVGSLRASKWQALGTNYIFSTSTPYVAPASGTLWYYGNASEADILVCGSDGWKGYRTLTSDSRGYNLTLTDPMGPIFSPTKPTVQSGGNAVVAGEVWVDTSDPEMFPVIYRYNGTSWNLIDNTDRITQNGILFADARWDASTSGGHDVGGIVDPVTGDLPSIATMALSSYVDLDAPDYRLYPRGTLLWNTRRNGNNVKQFVANKFTTTAYPNATNNGSHRTGTIPTYTSTWSNASGLQSNGTPFSGHMAQRQMVIKALKAAIDTNTDVREDQYQFDLIVCPGYPELIPNMNNLNLDRAQTAFVIGDTPMDLTPDTVSITAWNKTETTRNEYVAVYYPAGLTTDYKGNDIAVPASHMALRSYIYNDNVAYKWFAPAGTKRGAVSNANNIGYVNYATGEFVKTGITQSQRDALYNLNINPISMLPGAGLTIFGNKTRSAVAQATDRVNVSRLVTYIRTVLSKITNQYLFEPNDKATRDSIAASISSVFNDLITKRGIYDYVVVCDTSNNTSSRITANQLWVDIAIEPMKDVEFIYIPIRLENPGTITASAKQ